MQHRLRFTLAAAVLVSGVAVSGPVFAESAANFYRDRTITLVYGFGAGGTYGKYSLMLAQHLGKQIPGKPKIITQSMPGAGGIKATNYAYNVMPRDGSAIFMPPDSVVISQLLRPSKVKYRASRFSWLGTVVQSNSVIVVRTDSGIKSLADLRTKQVIMASTGKGSQTFLMPSLMNGLFGSRFKIVTGYRGSRGSQLAMERGEAQGVSLTWLAWKTGKPHWFTKGFAKAIVQIGYIRDPDLLDVPLMTELVRGPDRKIVNFMASLAPIGRGLALPPGVPIDRVNALRTAFEETVFDPAFRKEVEKRNLVVNPLTGPEVQRIVTESLDVSDSVLRRARSVILGAGAG